MSSWFSYIRNSIIREEEVENAEGISASTSTSAEQDEESAALRYNNALTQEQKEHIKEVLRRAEHSGRNVRVLMDTRHLLRRDISTDIRAQSPNAVSSTTTPLPDEEPVVQMESLPEDVEVSIGPYSYCSYASSEISSEQIDRGYSSCGVEATELEGICASEIEEEGLSIAQRMQNLSRKIDKWLRSLDKEDELIESADKSNAEAPSKEEELANGNNSGKLDGSSSLILNYMETLALCICVMAAEKSAQELHQKATEVIENFAEHLVREAIRVVLETANSQLIDGICEKMTRQVLEELLVEIKRYASYNSLKAEIEVESELCYTILVEEHQSIKSSSIRHQTDLIVERIEENAIPKAVGAEQLTEEELDHIANVQKMADEEYFWALVSPAQPIEEVEKIEVETVISQEKAENLLQNDEAGSSLLTSSADSAPSEVDADELEFDASAIQAEERIKEAEASVHNDEAGSSLLTSSADSVPSEVEADELEDETSIRAEEQIEEEERAIPEAIKEEKLTQEELEHIARIQRMADEDYFWSITASSERMTGEEKNNEIEAGVKEFEGKADFNDEAESSLLTSGADSVASGDEADEWEVEANASRIEERMEVAKEDKLTEAELEHIARIQRMADEEFWAITAPEQTTEERNGDELQFGIREFDEKKKSSQQESEAGSSLLTSSADSVASEVEPDDSEAEAVEQRMKEEVKTADEEYFWALIALEGTAEERMNVEIETGIRESNEKSENITLEDEAGSSLLTSSADSEPSEAGADEWEVEANGIRAEQGKEITQAENIVTETDITERREKADSEDEAGSSLSTSGADSVASEVEANELEFEASASRAEEQIEEPEDAIPEAIRGEKFTEDEHIAPIETMADEEYFWSLTAGERATEVEKSAEMEPDITESQVKTDRRIQDDEDISSLSTSSADSAPSEVESGELQDEAIASRAEERKDGEKAILDETDDDKLTVDELQHIAQIQKMADEEYFWTLTAPERNTAKEQNIKLETDLTENYKIDIKDEVESSQLTSSADSVPSEVEADEWEVEANISQVEEQRIEEEDKAIPKAIKEEKLTQEELEHIARIQRMADEDYFWTIAAPQMETEQQKDVEIETGINEKHQKTDLEDEMESSLSTSSADSLPSEEVEAIVSRFGEQKVEEKTIPEAINEVNLTEEELEHIARIQRMADEEFWAITAPEQTIEGKMDVEMEIGISKSEEKGEYKPPEDEAESSLLTSSADSSPSEVEADELVMPKETIIEEENDEMEIGITEGQENGNLEDEAGSSLLTSSADSIPSDVEAEDLEVVANANRVEERIVKEAISVATREDKLTEEELEHIARIQRMADREFCINSVPEKASEEENIEMEIGGIAESHEKFESGLPEDEAGSSLLTSSADSALSEVEADELEVEADVIRAEVTREEENKTIVVAIKEEAKNEFEHIPKTADEEYFWALIASERINEELKDVELDTLDKGIREIPKKAESTLPEGEVGSNLLTSSAVSALSSAEANELESEAFVIRTEGPKIGKEGAIPNVAITDEDYFWALTAQEANMNIEMETGITKSQEKDDLENEVVPGLFSPGAYSIELEFEANVHRTEVPMAMGAKEEKLAEDEQPEHSARIQNIVVDDEFFLALTTSERTTEEEKNIAMETGICESHEKGFQEDEVESSLLTSSADSVASEMEGGELEVGASASEAEERIADVEEAIPIVTNEDKLTQEELEHIARIQRMADEEFWAITAPEQTIEGKMDVEMEIGISKSEEKGEYKPPEDEAESSLLTSSADSSPSEVEADELVMPKETIIEEENDEMEIGITEGQENGNLEDEAGSSLLTSSADSIPSDVEAEDLEVVSNVSQVEEQRDEEKETIPEAIKEEKLTQEELEHIARIQRMADEDYFWTIAAPQMETEQQKDVEIETGINEKHQKTDLEDEMESSLSTSSADSLPSEEVEAIVSRFGEQKVEEKTIQEAINEVNLTENELEHIAQVQRMADEEFWAMTAPQRTTEKNVEMESDNRKFKEIAKAGFQNYEAGSSLLTSGAASPGFEADKWEIEAIRTEEKIQEEEPIEKSEIIHLEDKEGSSELISSAESVPSAEFVTEDGLAKAEKRLSDDEAGSSLLTSSADSSTSEVDADELDVEANVRRAEESEEVAILETKEEKLTEVELEHIARIQRMADEEFWAMTAPTSEQEKNIVMESVFCKSSEEADLEDETKSSLTSSADSVASEIGANEFEVEANASGIEGQIEEEDKSIPEAIKEERLTEEELEHIARIQKMADEDYFWAMTLPERIIEEEKNVKMENGITENQEKGDQEYEIESILFISNAVSASSKVETGEFEAVVNASLVEERIEVKPIPEAIKEVNLTEEELEHIARIQKMADEEFWTTASPERSTEKEKTVEMEIGIMAFNKNADLDDEAGSSLSTSSADSAPSDVEAEDLDEVKSIQAEEQIADVKEAIPVAMNEEKLTQAELEHIARIQRMADEEFWAIKAPERMTGEEKNNEIEAGGKEFEENPDLDDEAESSLSTSSADSVASGVEADEWEVEAIANETEERIADVEEIIPEAIKEDKLTEEELEHIARIQRMADEDYFWTMATPTAPEWTTEERKDAEMEIGTMEVDANSSQTSGADSRSLSDESMHEECEIQKHAIFAKTFGGSLTDEDYQLNGRFRGAAYEVSTPLLSVDLEQEGEEIEEKVQSKQSISSLQIQQFAPQPADGVRRVRQSSLTTTVISYTNSVAPKRWLSISDGADQIIGRRQQSTEEAPERKMSTSSSVKIVFTDERLRRSFNFEDGQQQADALEIWPNDGQTEAANWEDNIDFMIMLNFYAQRLSEEIADEAAQDLHNIIYIKQNPRAAYFDEKYCNLLKDADQMSTSICSENELDVEECENVAQMADFKEREYEVCAISQSQEGLDARKSTYITSPLYMLSSFIGRRRSSVERPRSALPYLLRASSISSNNNTRKQSKGEAGPSNAISALLGRKASTDIRWLEGTEDTVEELPDNALVGLSQQERDHILSVIADSKRSASADAAASRSSSSARNPFNFGEFDESERRHIQSVIEKAERREVKEQSPFIISQRESAAIGAQQEPQEQTRRTEGAEIVSGEELNNPVDDGTAKEGTNIGIDLVPLGEEENGHDSNMGKAVEEMNFGFGEEVQVKEEDEEVEEEVEEKTESYVEEEQERDDVQEEEGEEDEEEVEEKTESYKEEEEDEERIDEIEEFEEKTKNYLKEEQVYEEEDVEEKTESYKDNEETESEFDQMEDEEEEKLPVEKSQIAMELPGPGEISEQELEHIRSIQRQDMLLQLQLTKDQQNPEENKSPSLARLRFEEKAQQISAAMPDLVSSLAKMDPGKLGGGIPTSLSQLKSKGSIFGGFGAKLFGTKVDVNKDKVESLGKAAAVDIGEPFEQSVEVGREQICGEEEENREHGPCSPEFWKSAEETGLLGSSTSASSSSSGLGETVSTAEGDESSSLALQLDDSFGESGFEEFKRVSEQLERMNEALRFENSAEDITLDGEQALSPHFRQPNFFETAMDRKETKGKICEESEEKRYNGDAVGQGNGLERAENDGKGSEEEQWEREGGEEQPVHKIMGQLSPLGSLGSGLGLLGLLGPLGTTETKEEEEAAELAAEEHPNENETSDETAEVGPAEAEASLFGRGRQAAERHWEESARGAGGAQKAKEEKLPPTTAAPLGTIDSGVLAAAGMAQEQRQQTLQQQEEEMPAAVGPQRILALLSGGTAADRQQQQQRGESSKSICGGGITAPAPAQPAAPEKGEEERQISAVITGPPAEAEAADSFSAWAQAPSASIPISLRQFVAPAPTTNHRVSAAVQDQTGSSNINSIGAPNLQHRQSEKQPIAQQQPPQPQLNNGLALSRGEVERVPTPFLGDPEGHPLEESKTSTAPVQPPSKPAAQFGAMFFAPGDKKSSPKMPTGFSGFGSKFGKFASDTLKGAKQAGEQLGAKAASAVAQASQTVEAAVVVQPPSSSASHQQLHQRASEAVVPSSPRPHSAMAFPSASSSSPMGGIPTPEQCSTPSLAGGLILPPGFDDLTEEERMRIISVMQCAQIDAGMDDDAPGPMAPERQQQQRPPPPRVVSQFREETSHHRAEDSLLPDLSGLSAEEQHQIMAVMRAAAGLDERSSSRGEKDQQTPMVMRHPQQQREAPAIKEEPKSPEFVEERRQKMEHELWLEKDAELVESAAVEAEKEEDVELMGGGGAVLAESELEDLTKYGQPVALIAQTEAVAEVGVAKLEEETEEDDVWIQPPRQEFTNVEHWDMPIQSSQRKLWTTVFSDTEPQDQLAAAQSAPQDYQRDESGDEQLLLEQISADTVRGCWERGAPVMSASEVLRERDAGREPMETVEEADELAVVARSIYTAGFGTTDDGHQKQHNTKGDFTMEDTHCNSYEIEMEDPWSPSFSQAPHSMAEAPKANGLVQREPQLHPAPPIITVTEEQDSEEEEEEEVAGEEERPTSSSSGEDYPDRVIKAPSASAAAVARLQEEREIEQQRIFQQIASFGEAADDEFDVQWAKPKQPTDQQQIQTAAVAVVDAIASERDNFFLEDQANVYSPETSVHPQQQQQPPESREAKPDGGEQRPVGGERVMYRQRTNPFLVDDELDAKEEEEEEEEDDEEGAHDGIVVRQVHLDADDRSDEFGGSDAERYYKGQLEHVSYFAHRPGPVYTIQEMEEEEGHVTNKEGIYHADRIEPRIPLHSETVPPLLPPGAVGGARKKSTGRSRAQNTPTFNAIVGTEELTDDSHEQQPKPVRSAPPPPGGDSEEASTSAALCSAATPTHPVSAALHLQQQLQQLNQHKFDTNITQPPDLPPPQRHSAVDAPSWVLEEEATGTVGSPRLKRSPAMILTGRDNGEQTAPKGAAICESGNDVNALREKTIDALVQPTLPTKSTTETSSSAISTTSSTTTSAIPSTSTTTATLTSAITASAETMGRRKLPSLPTAQQHHHPFAMPSGIGAQSHFGGFSAPYGVASTSSTAAAQQHPRMLYNGVGADMAQHYQQTVQAGQSMQVPSASFSSTAVTSSSTTPTVITYYTSSVPERREPDQTYAKVVPSSTCTTGSRVLFDQFAVADAQTAALAPISWSARMSAAAATTTSSTTTIVGSARAHGAYDQQPKGACIIPGATYHVDSSGSQIGARHHATGAHGAPLVLPPLPADRFISQSVSPPPKRPQQQQQARSKTSERATQETLCQLMFKKELRSALAEKRKALDLCEIEANHRTYQIDKWKRSGLMPPRMAWAAESDAVPAVVKCTLPMELVQGCQIVPKQQPQLQQHQMSSPHQTSQFPSPKQRFGTPSGEPFAARSVGCQAEVRKTPFTLSHPVTSPGLTQQQQQRVALSFPHTADATTQTPLCAETQTELGLFNGDGGENGDWRQRESRQLYYQPRESYQPRAQNAQRSRRRSRLSRFLSSTTDTQSELGRKERVLREELSSRQRALAYGGLSSSIDDLRQQAADADAHQEECYQRWSESLPRNLYFRGGQPQQQKEQPYAAALIGGQQRQERQMPAVNSGLRTQRYHGSLPRDYERRFDAGGGCQYAQIPQQPPTGGPFANQYPRAWNSMQDVRYGGQFDTDPGIWPQNVSRSANYIGQQLDRRGISEEGSKISPIAPRYGLPGGTAMTTALDDSRLAGWTPRVGRENVIGEYANYLNNQFLFEQRQHELADRERPQLLLEQGAEPAGSYFGRSIQTNQLQPQQQLQQNYPMFGDSRPPLFGDSRSQQQPLIYGTDPFMRPPLREQQPFFVQPPPVPFDAPMAPGLVPGVYDRSESNYGARPPPAQWTPSNYGNMYWREPRVPPAGQQQDQLNNNNNSGGYWMERLAQQPPNGPPRQLNWSPNVPSYQQPLQPIHGILRRPPAPMEMAQLPGGSGMWQPQQLGSAEMGARRVLTTQLVSISCVTFMNNHHYLDGNRLLYERSRNRVSDYSFGDANIEKFCSPLPSIEQCQSRRGEIKRLLLTRKFKNENIFKDLGIRVVGGKKLQNGELGAFIASVDTNKAQETLGELKEGDQVLEWNGDLLCGKTFEEVERIVKSAASAEVELIVRCGRRTSAERAAASNEKRKKNITFVESTKKGHNWHSPNEPPPVPAHQNGHANKWEGATTNRSLPKRPKLLEDLAQSERMNGAPVNGHLKLSIGYDSLEWVLRIGVYSARGLVSHDEQPPNPFVKIYLLPERIVQNKRRTKFVTATANPIFEQEVEYYVAPNQLRDHFLELTILDYRKSENRCLGQVLVNLSDLSIIDGKPRWFALHLPPFNASSGSDDSLSGQKQRQRSGGPKWQQSLLSSTNYNPSTLDLGYHAIA